MHRDLILIAGIATTLACVLAIVTNESIYLLPAVLGAGAFAWMMVGAVRERVAAK